jgi:hypothetical protein
MPPIKKEPDIQSVDQQQAKSAATPPLAVTADGVIKKSSLKKRRDNFTKQGSRVGLNTNGGGRKLKKKRRQVRPKVQTTLRIKARFD